MKPIQIPYLPGFNEYIPTARERNQVYNVLHEQSYFYKCNKVYVGTTDEHLNTYIFTNTGSRKLLVVIGESWTYGDSLIPYVKAADKIDNVMYRLSTIFGGKVSNFLCSDLFLFAKPGNSNFDYFSSMAHIFEYIFGDCNYDEIYFIIQMTSPGRDINNGGDKRLSHLFSQEKNEFPILNWNDWLIEYDKVYLNWLQETILKYPINDTVLWKNFNEFHYIDKTHKYKIINVPFFRYAIECSGIKVTMANNFEPSFLDNSRKIYNLAITDDELNYEIELINDCFDKLNKSILNNYHPNDEGHWVLSTLILETLKQKAT